MRRIKLLAGKRGSIYSEQGSQNRRGGTCPERLRFKPEGGSQSWKGETHPGRLWNKLERGAEWRAVGQARTTQTWNQKEGGQRRGAGHTWRMTAQGRWERIQPRWVGPSQKGGARERKPVAEGWNTLGDPQLGKRKKGQLLHGKPLQWTGGEELYTDQCGNSKNPGLGLSEGHRNWGIEGWESTSLRDWDKSIATRLKLFKIKDKGTRSFWKSQKQQIKIFLFSLFINFVLPWKDSRGQGGEGRAVGDSGVPYFAITVCIGAVPDRAYFLLFVCFFVLEHPPMQPKKIIKTSLLNIKVIAGEIISSGRGSKGIVYDPCPPTKHKKMKSSCKGHEFYSTYNWHLLWIRRDFL